LKVSNIEHSLVVRFRTIAPSLTTVEQMPAYRLYDIKDANKIASPPAVVECASDVEAIEKAKTVLNGLDIEIWNGARLVTRLQSKDK
jgi:hypothetical protein